MLHDICDVAVFAVDLRVLGSRKHRLVKVVWAVSRHDVVGSRKGELSLLLLIVINFLVLYEIRKTLVPILRATCRKQNCLCLVGISLIHKRQHVWGAKLRDLAEQVVIWMRLLDLLQLIDMVFQFTVLLLYTFLLIFSRRLLEKRFPTEINLRNQIFLHVCISLGKLGLFDHRNMGKSIILIFLSSDFILFPLDLLMQILCTGIRTLIIGLRQGVHSRMALLAHSYRWGNATALLWSIDAFVDPHFNVEASV